MIRTADRGVNDSEQRESLLETAAKGSDGMTITFAPDASAISQFREEQAALARLAGDERRLAQEAISRARRDLVQRYSDLTLQRSFNSPDAETEQLVWFWFNHFNVYPGRRAWLAWLCRITSIRAIRPHVRGSFRDMLLSVLSHPAMLVYLDNVSNTAGRGNENLARELLELHTLGVNGGYSQADVREVARVLTGMGLRPLTPGKKNPEEHPLAKARGEFLFDPYKHQGGAKEVLGQTIDGGGFAEVEALADLLATHPATARHISGKLSRHLLGVASSEAQQAHAAYAFLATQGNLGSTVAAIREKAGGGATPGRTFKDPYRYVSTAVELLRDGQAMQNAVPVVRWISTLGQPLFGCRTPDGYSLDGDYWLSSGQLAQRFELAPTMVAAVGRLTEKPVPAEAAWASRSATELLATLPSSSRRAIAQAATASDRLALLLSSPEFMYW
jgi:uncharacterized protein (DUF1800 family)